MNRLLLLAVAVALATVVGVAVGGSARLSYAPAVEVSGEFKAIGPDTMEGVMQKWIAGFRQRQPGARISYQVAGVDARDRIAIGPGTNEVFASTNEPFVRRYGYEPFHVMVSLATFNTPQRVQALGVFVHPGNPLAQLSLDQLDRIYSAARRRTAGPAVRTWGDLGLTGAWAARPVHAYSRQLDNEVTTHFREVVCRGAGFSGDVKVPGKGVSVDVVGAVADDPDGIGFAGFAYQSKGVKALALGETEAGPFYVANQETCAAFRYPLDRPLYFYVNRRPGASLDPIVREFISYVLSLDGQRMNLEEKYIPLTSELAAAQTTKLN